MCGTAGDWCRVSELRRKGVPSLPLCQKSEACQPPLIASPPPRPAPSPAGDPVLHWLCTRPGAAAALQEGADPTPCRFPAPHVHTRTELSAGTDPGVVVFIAGFPGPPGLRVCTSSEAVLPWVGKLSLGGHHPCDPCSGDMHTRDMYPCLCVCEGSVFSWAVHLSAAFQMNPQGWCAHTRAHTHTNTHTR